MDYSGWPGPRNSMSMKQGYEVGHQRINSINQILVYYFKIEIKIYARFQIITHSYVSG